MPPGGGPFKPNGVYEWDLGYFADLERAIAVVVSYFEAPGLAPFLRAQSHEEVGYGRLFSTHLNFWNVGNTDEHPRSVPYATPEDAGRAYCEFIDPFGNGSGRYGAFMAAVHAGETDILTLATLIWRAGYATSPNYPAQVAGKP